MARRRSRKRGSSRRRKSKTLKRKFVGRTGARQRIGYRF